MSSAAERKARLLAKQEARREAERRREEQEARELAELEEEEGRAREEEERRLQQEEEERLRQEELRRRQQQEEQEPTADQRRWLLNLLRREALEGRRDGTVTAESSRGGGTKGPCWACQTRGMVCERPASVSSFFWLYYFSKNLFSSPGRSCVGCASAKRKCAMTEEGSRKGQRPRTERVDGKGKAKEAGNRRKRKRVGEEDDDEDEEAEEERGLGLVWRDLLMGRLSKMEVQAGKLFKEVQGLRKLLEGMQEGMSELIQMKRDLAEEPQTQNIAVLFKSKNSEPENTGKEGQKPEKEKRPQKGKEAEELEESDSEESDSSE